LGFFFGGWKARSEAGPAGELAPPRAVHPARARHGTRSHLIWRVGPHTACRGRGEGAKERERERPRARPRALATKKGKKKKNGRARVTFYRPRSACLWLGAVCTASTSIFCRREEEKAARRRPRGPGAAERKSLVAPPTVDGRQTPVPQTPHTTNHAPATAGRQAKVQATRSVGGARRACWGSEGARATGFPMGRKRALNRLSALPAGAGGLVRSQKPEKQKQKNTHHRPSSAAWTV
jgi:hypothetical protein